MRITIRYDSTITFTLHLAVRWAECRYIWVKERNTESAVAATYSIYSVITHHHHCYIHTYIYIWYTHAPRGARLVFVSSVRCAQCKLWKSVKIISQSVAYELLRWTPRIPLVAFLPSSSFHNKFVLANLFFFVCEWVSFAFYLYSYIWLCLYKLRQSVDGPERSFAFATLADIGFRYLQSKWKIHKNVNINAFG